MDHWGLHARPDQAARSAPPPRNPSVSVVSAPAACPFLEGPKDESSSATTVCSVQLGKAGYLTCLRYSLSSCSVKGRSLCCANANTLKRAVTPRLHQCSYLNTISAGVSSRLSLGDRTPPVVHPRLAPPCLQTPHTHCLLFASIALSVGSSPSPHA